MLYSGFNISPRSVFRSANFNARSDNTDVMRLNLFLFMLSHFGTVKYKGNL